MIYIISGTTHTGKTILAQKLLEKYNYPYLSIDHLKMGLIRSGNTELTPLSSDEELTTYLWPIVREIIKTAIENGQNLIVEGCYVPFDFLDDFNKEYMDNAKYIDNIKYIFLIMSDNYINRNYDMIKKYANVIEKRLDDSDCTIETLLTSNNEYLNKCKERELEYILIDESYEESLRSLKFL